MDAWTILLAGSTSPSGSDAWTHLNNQAGGENCISYVLDSVSVKPQEPKFINILLPDPISLDVLQDKTAIDVKVPNKNQTTVTSPLINIDVSKCP